MASLLPIPRMLALALGALREQWWRLCAVALASWLPFGIAFLMWASMYLELDKVALSLQSVGQVASSIRWEPGLFVGLALLVVLYVCSVSVASNAGGLVAQAHVQGEKPSVRSVLLRSCRRLPRSAVAYLAITGSFILFMALIVTLTLLLTWACVQTLGLEGYAIALTSVGAAAVSAGVVLPVWLWVYARIALAPVVAAVAPTSSKVMPSAFRATRERAAGILGRSLVVSLLSAVVLSVPATLALVLQLGGVWLGLAAVALRAALSVSSAALQTLAMTPVYYSTQAQESPTSSAHSHGPG